MNTQLTLHEHRIHCLKSKMSIQPRYDASFLAVNDELTITI